MLFDHTLFIEQRSNWLATRLTVVRAVALEPTFNSFIELTSRL